MDSDQDLKWAIGLNRFNLHFLGVWPDPTVTSREETTLTKYRFLIPGLLILTFICGPQSANIYFIWGNLDLMTENVATANVPSFMAVARLFLLGYHREALRPLLIAFVEDWRNEKTESQRATMLKNGMLSRMVSIGCTVLTDILMVVFVTLRMVIVTRLDKNVTSADRFVIYPAYFPYDMRESPAFELTSLGQVMAAYCALSSATGVDSFITMLILHVCGQFSNLHDTLRGLFDDVIEKRTYKEFRVGLAKIIKRHEHLHWFVKTIENCFNVLLLVQMLGCTVQLCFQAFQAVSIVTQKRSDSTFQLVFIIFYITFVMVHMYLYCYIGEMLIEQSTGMGFAAYDSKWYKASAGEAKNILPIMQRSLMPLCLTAGKFSTFSMEMFSNILRMSLGYLSVLLTVSHIQ